MVKPLKILAKAIEAKKKNDKEAYEEYLAILREMSKKEKGK